ncbi:MAG: PDZ domain-containing protein [Candidatus Acidiferrum sp.]
MPRSFPLILALPGHRLEHGAMELAKVPENGPAGKAGLKSGDVLIEYGGRKIDSDVDFAGLVHAYSEGERVMATVLRGHEKITKEVTLEPMK